MVFEQCTRVHTNEAFWEMIQCISGGKFFYTMYPCLGDVISFATVRKELETVCESETCPKTFYVCWIPT
jgi:hypothetical protein